MPIQTERSEHARQNPNEGPSLPWPGWPHLGNPVQRKENWFDRNMPYATGMAQFTVGQLVGISKIAKVIDDQLGIDEPMTEQDFDSLRPHELPAMKKMDEKLNKMIEDFADEGPSNKEEVRGQVIANLLEVDLGEKQMEWLTKTLAISNFLGFPSKVKDMLEYFKRFKTAISYTEKMSKRTLTTAFLSGMQTLFQTGGDVDKAIEEAKTQVKMGAVIEVAGLGITPVMGEHIAGHAIEDEIEDVESGGGGDNPSSMARDISSAADKDIVAAEDRLMAKLEIDEKASGRISSADEYAEIGLGDDPLHVALAPEEHDETQVDQVVENARKAKHVGSQLDTDDSPISKKDKKRLDDLRRARIDLEAVIAAMRK